LSEDQKNLKQEIVRKVLDADFKNIVEKVRAGKTLTATERKTLEENKGQEKWEELGISRSAFFKYKKLGMPERAQEAEEWLQVRAGLASKGSGKIEVGGRTFEAKDLIDLRGKVLEGQAENILLKNRIEKLNLDEREGKLVDSDLLCATMAKILYPLKKALDQMPENLAQALNPEDPSRAESILEQELENIYADLCKNLQQDEGTQKLKI